MSIEFITQFGVLITTFLTVAVVAVVVGVIVFSVMSAIRNFIR
jgi:hypothetical protein